MSAIASIRGLSVLADPTRAAILRMMLEAEDGRVLVGRTADELGLRQPTVSHHMKALLDDGMVTREPSGRRTWYAIAPDQRERVAALFPRDSQSEPSDPDLSRIVEDLLIRIAGSGVERDVVARLVVETHGLLAATSDPRLLASRTAAFAADRLDDMSGR